MQITSTNFDNLDALPDQFSKNGGNKHPSLTFSEIPGNAKSLSLIVEDPDAPSGTFTHWILYNMSPGTLQIIEGELPLTGSQGKNDVGENSYYGPQPPSGTHRYYFKLFALDTVLETNDSYTATTFNEAMDNHVLEAAEIIGTYSA